MAFRLSRRLKPIAVSAVAIGAALTLIPTVASATPDNPPAPTTVASVQQRLDELSQRNSQLVEQYNHARVVASTLQRDAAAAKKAAARAHAAYEKARVALTATITAEYEGGSFSATGALLSSTSGASYLERLNTLSMMSAHTSGVLSSIASTQREAEQAQAKANKLFRDAKAKVAELDKRKTQVQADIDKFTGLLDTLTAAQRTAFLRASTPAVPAATASTMKLSPAGTGAARKAVAFALQQLGKPYVFGASGPGSYDCSGLTMAAWAAAGVSLPHSAADQFNYGHHVSLDSLKPGDLIFEYQPIGHVTIYVGNGMMVSAPQTGDVVSLIPVSSGSGSIVGATRLV